MQDKLRLLAEAEQEAADMQRYLDRITGLLHAARHHNDLKTLRITHDLLKDERQAMNRHADLLNAKLDKLKEGKMKGFERLLVGLLIVVLFGALVVSFASAQDEPLAPSNTPQVIEGVATPIASTAVPAVDVIEVGDIVPTEEAPVVIINNPPPPDPAPASDWSERLAYILGFVILLAYTGIKEYAETRKTESLVNTVNKGLDNKQIQDEARERYMQASMDNKEFIKLLGAVFSFAGSLNLPVVDPAADKAAQFFTDLTTPEDGSPQPPSIPTIPDIPDPDPFRRQYPADFGTPTTQT